MQPAYTNLHLALWAKTSRRHDDTQYHPLICHLIDVSCVARALWDHVIPPSFQARVAQGLGIEETRQAGAWVSFLAGLHDLGKASPGFQQKNTPGWNRVRSTGYSVPDEPRDVGHGTVSAHALQELLTDPTFGALPGRLVNRFVAGAVGGHHGIFPMSEEVHRAGVEDVRGAADWAKARHDLAKVVAKITGISTLQSPTTIDTTTATLIAGLVSVADWIGSDECYFSYAAPNGELPAIELDAYLDRATEIAAQTLTNLGWSDWTPSASSLTLKQLFPYIETARPIQQTITELNEIGDAPGIAIIESPMGEGKTEAAFYLADRWCTTIGQHGCYVAMPTMATSNHMFGRMRQFLVGRYPGETLNLQLLHSQAALEIEEEASDPSGEPALHPSQIYDNDASNGDGQGQVLAREWFTRSKRGLLAPFGVGTVDQSLLAILSTPHHFVRLFGLAGKTIIFDEVHAYDVYMTTLFERLMIWLGALGSSVVVLSATLPDVRRRQLLAAYAAGAGIDDSAAKRSAAYPRLSWLNATGGDVLTVDTSDDVRRTLAIEWINGPHEAKQPWEELALWLKEKLPVEGCAAVICNTVKHAQEVYQALQSSFPDIADDGEPELDLLHARFPFEERATREARALRRFGKPDGAVVSQDGSTTPVRRPRRAVLVATQIIEQSLDLDFDLMVSEVAPVDLLLQRSGRLQRHRRDRRPKVLEHPTLWLINPGANDGVPKFRGGTPNVYEPHLLFRTWLTLRDLETIAIPESIGQLVESVYDLDQPAPACLTTAQFDHWQATHEKLNTTLRDDAEQARVREIPRPQACERISELTRNFRREDAPDLHTAHQALTRLGGPSVSLICLYRTVQGQALDYEGKESVDLNLQPDTSLARRLLRRSVSVSLRGVAYPLLEVEPPPGWRRSSLLRHHRVAVFDEHGRTEVDGVRLRLDPQLGLQVEGKEDK